MPPGGGTPRHVHSVETESFYVIDGVVTFNLGRRRSMRIRAPS
ncbi:cupin domain-containing protein [Aliirhizobium terrae]